VLLLPKRDPLDRTTILPRPRPVINPFLEALMSHEKFSFDQPCDGNNNMDDDNGYYSSVSMSEQRENDGDDEAGGDQLETSPMNRILNRNGAAAASAFRRPSSTSFNRAFCCWCPWWCLLFPPERK
jgi:hypothetical protein